MSLTGPTDRNRTRPAKQPWSDYQLSSRWRDIAAEHFEAFEPLASGTALLRPEGPVAPAQTQRGKDRPQVSSCMWNHRPARRSTGPEQRLAALKLRAVPQRGKFRAGGLLSRSPRPRFKVRRQWHRTLARICNRLVMAEVFNRIAELAVEMACGSPAGGCLSFSPSERESKPCTRCANTTP